MSIDVIDGHEAQVGGITVRRVLPRRGLRTVGPWCFADQMGPVEVTEESGLDVGPHPHTGLQTVTWLMSGAALHKDSLGSEQLIRPGQLNLMTAGHGIAHAEEATRTYRGTLHGMQLWVAQPDALRAGASAFAHHADLPSVEVGGAVGTVLAGTFMGATSPASFGSPIVGVDLVLPVGETLVPLNPEWEYAVVPVDGSALVAGNVVRPGQLGSLGSARDEVVLQGPARVLLLGGEPLHEPLVMWWNFVARSRDEIALAYRQWQQGDERFGGVPSRLARIPAPAPPWLG
jgi:redox-sensitive bicupin YhaK (pirin superfamily)